jgi:hypothetical protein
MKVDNIRQSAISHYYTQIFELKFKSVQNIAAISSITNHFALINIETELIMKIDMANL